MATQSTKMTLADVVRVKQMADSISFMRLFFLKNQSDQISFRKGDDTSTYASKTELIDCVMAIYMFEITRAVRTGKHMYRKD